MNEALRLVSDQPYVEQFDEAWGEMAEVITDAIIRNPVVALEAIARREDYLIDGLDDDIINAEDDEISDRVYLDEGTAHDIAIELLEAGFWADIHEILENVDKATAAEKAAREAEAAKEEGTEG